MKKISLFDSTLRDGAQAMGISFSVEDKLSMIRLLDRVGVDVIEAGNPFSNPKDLALYQRATELTLRHAKLAAFGSTRRKWVAASEDQNLQALLRAKTEICVLFGKSSLFHVAEVLETTAQENLLMIEESCRFLSQNGRRVFFDAEHFFDGYNENSEYALECLRAAVRGGAEKLCLCDTNGGTLPPAVAPVITAVQAAVGQSLAVHFHSDCGMAEANSLVAIAAGADQVQGTFLGFGERCGNANLCTLIGSLQLKLAYSCIPPENLGLLTAFAREMAELHNIDLPRSMPFVGANAFSHKAGMHAAAVLKNTQSFEHIPPEAVGNRRRLPASEFSGRRVILGRIRSVFPEISGEDAEEILQELKGLEQNGYQFDGADASFELLVRRQQGLFHPHFHLISYRIFTKNEEDASATVKLQVGDTVQLMAAEGNGPVNALDSALRKALEVFYPKLAHVKLTDYKVRVLESKEATAARVRVLITSKYKGRTFTTVGVSGDVVAASWKALEESLEYSLL